MPSESETTTRVQGILAIPLNRFLGMELRVPGDASAGLWFRVGPTTQNQAAVLHGGVVTTLLDTACYLALLPSLSDAEHAVTHGLTVSLLRPVSADKRVDITGTVLRRGRAVAFLRAEATVDGEVVAAAQVTKSVVRVG